ncbi:MAG: hypothetical protein Kow0010_21260 [Dehalococcoidia bacterium]
MRLTDLELHFDLTDTEREVLRLVARGWTDQEIARQLVVSRHAVHSRVQRFAEKTGLHGPRLLGAWCGKHEECCIVRRA